MSDLSEAVKRLKSRIRAANTPMSLGAFIGDADGYDDAIRAKKNNQAHAADLALVVAALEASQAYARTQEPTP